MQEEQTFYPVTTEYFTACLPLLEKYFGITAGYFNKELSNAKCLIPHREGNIVKYSIKEDCNLVLPFDTSNAMICCRLSTLTGQLPR